MKAQDWREDYAQFLEDFPWQWFCSLTFRPGLKPHQARRRLQRWLGDLREALGTPDFGWFAVREYGKTTENLHFHILILGLRKCDPKARVEWMRRWWKLSGDARIDPFSPGVGGALYILKDAQPNDPDAIEFELSSHTQMQTKLNKK